MKKKLIVAFVLVNLFLVFSSALLGKMAAQDKEGWFDWTDDSRSSYICRCEGIGCRPCWGQEPSFAEKIENLIGKWFFNNYE
ncbi:hypothetical protein JW877_01745 [bacterium]|nr:hypothetical protein [bacterium]